MAVEFDQSGTTPVLEDILNPEDSAGVSEHASYVVECVVFVHVIYF